MKQLPIEITNEQIGQELDMWFNNEACEALARETGFIRRSTSRLTGSAFFNLLTVEAMDEPTISYEGLCDRLEERHPNAQITPQALCERMNNDGAVAFLEAGLERTLKETTRQQSTVMEAAFQSATGYVPPSQRFDVTACRAIHTKRFGRGKYPVRHETGSQAG